MAKVKVIRVSNSWNTNSEIAKRYYRLINILEMDYGVGNDTEYDVLRTLSVFRGVQHLEWDVPEGKVYADAVYVDHYIAPDPRRELCRVLMERFNDQDYPMAFGIDPEDYGY